MVKLLDYDSLIQSLYKIRFILSTEYRYLYKVVLEEAGTFMNIVCNLHLVYKVATGRGSEF